MSSASDGAAGPPSSARRLKAAASREQRLSARRTKGDAGAADALNNAPGVAAATDLGASLLKNSNLFSSFVVKNKLQAGVPKKAAGSAGWQLVLKTALSSLQKEEVQAGEHACSFVSLWGCSVTHSGHTSLLPERHS